MADVASHIDLARADRIRAEQGALLYAQGVRSQIVTLANVVLVVVVLWHAAGRTALLGWAALMVAITAGRLLLADAYRRARPPVEAMAPWRARYVAAAGASGIGWGVASVVLFSQVSAAHQVFLAFVLGGMAVGAAAVMAPVLAAYWVFLPPITLPVIGQLLWRGDAMSIAMGVMFATCTGMFLSAARAMHGSISESIRLRFENLDLLQQTAESNRLLQIEIGERTRAEAQLTASLHEKEALLTEIHHRVKNNLQVVSSLLSLQSRTLTNPEVLEVFRESQNRVRSMALVHEKLYQAPDLARIDFGAYLRELASHLFRVYRTGGEPIPLRLDVRDVVFTIERAVPCGLIASELLSNALKYAFPAGRRGEIAIELRAVDAATCRLTVRDTGVGMPADFEPHRSPTLGLRIVHTLTRQLGGTLVVSNDGGAGFTLTLPVEEGDDARTAAADQHPDR